MNYYAVESIITSDYFIKYYMITNDNYYKVNNKALSQSKIKDYLKDPNYFYRRNILGEVEVKTDAFTVGGAVDDLLTDISNINKGIYVVVERRNLKTPPKGVIEVNQKQFDEIISIASAVETTSAWKEIKDTFTFQEIVEVKANLGKHFKCYVGKPDAYRIGSDCVCDLLDLKTTQSVDLRKYYYNSVSYGYFQQLWFYSFILKLKYPHIKSFRYYHLAAEKKEPFGVELFQIPNTYVEDCGSLMMLTIQKIAADTTFAKRDVSFINPTLLLNPRDYEEEDEE